MPARIQVMAGFGKSREGWEGGSLEPFKKGRETAGGQMGGALEQAGCLDMATATSITPWKPQTTNTVVGQQSPKAESTPPNHNPAYANRNSQALLPCP